MPNAAKVLRKDRLFMSVGGFSEQVGK
jgi:hypothetical protein